MSASRSLDRPRQGAGGGGAHQARRARRRAAHRAGPAVRQPAQPAGHRRAVLPSRAQARSLQPRDGRVLSRVPHGPERAAAAAGGAGAGPEDRVGPRPSRGDGNRDGPRRRAAAAERRQGHRDLEGPAAPAAAPARGGGLAAQALHGDREVERAARAPQGRSRRGPGRRTSTRRSTVTWRSWPSTAIA